MPHLDAAFRAVHGAQEPLRRAPQDPAAALERLDAWRGEGLWHLVTRGLEEPFGQELTLITPPAEKPPAWAFALLLGTAQTLAAAGRGLHAGARMAPSAPLDGGTSGLIALGVREDPLVVPPKGPALLQLVGVTLGEYGVMRKVGTALVLEKLAARDPLLHLDPRRA